MDESERLWRVRVGARYTEVALCVLGTFFLWITSQLAGHEPYMHRATFTGLLLSIVCMATATAIVFF